MIAEDHTRMSRRLEELQWPSMPVREVRTITHDEGGRHRFMQAPCTHSLTSVDRKASDIKETVSSPLAVVYFYLDAMKRTA